MKTKTQISTMYKLKSLALVGVLTVVGAAQSQANLLNNGDFTANAALFNAQSNPGATGYINEPGVGSSNPSTITGWDLQYAVQGWSYYGIEGAATGLPVGSPTWGHDFFGPQNTGGFTYMFMKPGGAGMASQGLSLAANTLYYLDFDVAGTAFGTAASYNVNIADGAGTYVTLNGVCNTSAFDHISATFTTPGTITGTPTISLLDTAGDYNNTANFANVYLSTTPVPEPTTAALAGLGIVLAGAGRWARRRTA